MFENFLKEGEEGEEGETIDLEYTKACANAIGCLSRQDLSKNEC